MLKDFTYVDSYLEKYVLAPKSENGNGGAGLERHKFHHLVKYVARTKLVTKTIQYFGMTISFDLIYDTEKTPIFLLDSFMYLMSEINYLKK